MAARDSQFLTQDNGTIEHRPVPSPVKRSAIIVGTLRDDATAEAEADQIRSCKQIVWMYPVKEGADDIARNVIYYKSKGKVVERQVFHASVHYDAIFSYIPFLTHKKLKIDALRNAAHVSMVLVSWSQVANEALGHEEESEEETEPPPKKLKLGEPEAASKDEETRKIGLKSASKDDETKKEKDRERIRQQTSGQPKNDTDLETRRQNCFTNWLRFRKGKFRLERLTDKKLEKIAASYYVVYNGDMPQPSNEVLLRAYRQLLETKSYQTIEPCPIWQNFIRSPTPDPDQRLGVSSFFGLDRSEPAVKPERAPVNRPRENAVDRPAVKPQPTPIDRPQEAADDRFEDNPYKRSRPLRQKIEEQIQTAVKISRDYRLGTVEERKYLEDQIEDAREILQVGRGLPLAPEWMKKFSKEVCDYKV